MRVNWKEIAISIDTPIIEALKIIEKGQVQIAVVTNSEEKLLGTVTDGDIRRGLLKGVNVEKSVKEIMNDNPIFYYEGDSLGLIRDKMMKTGIKQIPILTKENKLSYIEIRNVQKNDKTNPVVLMVGGLGTRLGELTKDCPKPLLKVGEKPILQTIIEGFRDEGFLNVCLSVNYKAEMIQEYFRDGSELGVNISYVIEEKRMGTAGSLSMLKEKINSPFFVMNGDILTNVKFNKLLDFHEEHDGIATMCVREYDFQVPYGVVKTDGKYITSIKEKPIQTFFVNAGVYMLDPQVFDYIPDDQYLDMPTLFQNLINAQKKTSLFPIREYWLDIGRFDDYQKASSDFKENFKE